MMKAKRLTKPQVSHLLSSCIIVDAKWLALISLNFFLIFTVAACDDTAFFFAGCIHDCLNQDDDDCLMRIMIARSEVKILSIFIFILLAEWPKQNKLSIDRQSYPHLGATRHGNNLFNYLLILWHLQIDLKDIEEAYEESFEESLAKTIEDKTSGDYQDLLLRILQPFDIEPDPKANHKKRKSYFYPSWFCSCILNIQFWFEKYMLRTFMAPL